MQRSLRIVFVAMTLAPLAGFSFGKARTQIALDQTVSVRVYDLAQLPGGTLTSAFSEAARLFRAAGIRINWERVAAAPEGSGMDMTGAASARSAQRRGIVVQIVQRRSRRVFPGALGFALPFTSSGAHVLIFYDRIDALVRSMDIAAYVVLGHAIAHELGHVLLGSSEHSVGGLMQGHWTEASWRLAAAGLLTCCRKEAERMDEGLWRFQDPYALPERDSMLAGSEHRPSPHY
jgi:hypothetical protein